MNNSDKKNQKQLAFFDLIQKTLASNESLVNVVSDLLGVGIDASYRRIRGAKSINFEEAAILSKHFNISMDSLTAVVSDQNSIHCRYLPLNLRDLSNYLVYIKGVSDIVGSLRQQPGSKIILSASDVPFFYLLHYKELTYFKLFSWSKNVYGFLGSYDDFVKQLDYAEIWRYYEQIVRDYQLISSTEVWTSGTIDTYLRLISYHFDTGDFSDSKIPLLLCSQLQDLSNTLKSWTLKGIKEPKETPFNLYISETDLENTFILLKQQKRTACIIKLFTINSLTTYEKKICDEVENWINNTVQRSTLISGASAKERYKFFNVQQQKVDFLIDKISKQR